MSDSAAEYDWSDRPWKDADLMRRLYLDEELTTREIADRFGCDNSTISRWLGEHDIEARENWVAGAEAASRLNRVERAQLRTLPSGYEYWGVRAPPTSDRSSEMAYVHRLLAVAEYGFEAVAGNDVHHKNGIPWDNRPSNIEPLGKSEHGRLHAEEYWSRARGSIGGGTA